MKNSEAILLVAGLVRREGKILFAKRSQSVTWYKGLWDLPGGHVEPGETDIQAVARELREEVGVEAVEVDPEPAVRLFDRAADGTVLAVLSVWNIVEWVGEPAAVEPDIHDELAWVSDDEIGTLELAHPEYAQLLTSRGE